MRVYRYMTKTNTGLLLLSSKGLHRSEQLYLCHSLAHSVPEESLGDYPIFSQPLD